MSSWAEILEQKLPHGEWEVGGVEEVGSSVPATPRPLVRQAGSGIFKSLATPPGRMPSQSQSQAHSLGKTRVLTAAALGADFPQSATLQERPQEACFLVRMVKKPPSPPIAALSSARGGSGLSGAPHGHHSLGGAPQTSGVVDVGVGSRREVAAALYLPDGKLNTSLLVRSGELLIAEKEYALAANIYQGLLRAGECTALAHFQLGRCCEAQSFWGDAQKHYEESIIYRPAFEVFRALAGILVRQSKDQAAALLLERTLELPHLTVSQRFELHKSCGNCWTRHGWGDQAAGKVEGLCQQSGKGQAGNGAFQSAEHHFLAALALNSSADEVRANLGVLYLQSQRLVDAKRHFCDALASNPKNALAFSGLGSCSFLESQFQTAHDCFFQSLELEINNPTALLYLVKCAYKLKTYNIASELLERYSERALVNCDLLYCLAGLQYHLGKMAETKETVLKILGMNANYTGAIDLLDRLER